ncbi:MULTISPECIES: LysR family transcriptional regulator [Rheinheimera]|uniref:LysR family transcriptional regulator n=1 Tax=Rheinheimera marina TaxID=1774958 RepID=A0ABV9JH29_9GAMM
MANNLELLRLFAAAAEADSFKAAAHRLAVSPQAVTRAVQQLEQQLGELLFHRSTRHVRLTRFGEEFALQARQQLQQLDALLNRRQQQPKEAEGLVRLTAPRSMRQVLMPVLNNFMLDHPAIQLDIRLTDQLSDVVDDQIDIGVRAGVIRDNRFIARTVGAVSMWVVASPTLLQQRAEPQHPAELADWPLTGMMDVNTGRPWLWYFRQGQHWQPRQFRLLVTEAEAELDAVLCGVGIGQLANFTAHQAVRDGRLIRLLADYQPDPWPLSVYRPQRGPVPERIRLLYDHLVRQLSLLDWSDPG